MFKLIFGRVSSFWRYCFERSISFSLKGICAAIFYSRVDKLKKSDVLFICHDNSRTAIVEGVSYAPIIDTIIDDLGSNVKNITLPAPFSKIYGAKAYGNVVMFNRTLLYSYIMRLLLQGNSNIKNTKNDPVVLSWISVLKHIQPKIIIGVNPSVELCIAAKLNNIWVADIQHGVLAPGNYYDVSKRAKIDQAGWPNEILCWDQFSKDFVDQNLGHLVEAKVIGHPAIYSKASTRLSNLRESTNVSKHIQVLITLTSLCPKSHLGDIYFEKIGIPSSLVEFIKDHGSAFVWKLRLHPAQMNNWKDKIFNRLSEIFSDTTNVFWDECNTETLHAALSKCSSHITYNSASAREASYMGIKSAILDTDESAVNLYFADLIENKMLSVFDLKEHKPLVDWIKENHRKKSVNTGESWGADGSGYVKFKAFIDDLKINLDSNP